MFNDCAKVVDNVNQGDLWCVVVSVREDPRRCHFCRVPCMDAQRVKSLKKCVRTETRVMILFAVIHSSLRTVVLSSWFGARCVNVVPAVLTRDVASFARKRIVWEVSQLWLPYSILEVVALGADRSSL